MAQPALKLADPSAPRSLGHSAPSGGDWSMLISVDEAAAPLGMSVGHLRRKCVEQLGPRHQAYLLKPPQGGNARWYLDRRHDPRLAAGWAGEAHHAPDLSRYTKKQQLTMWRRVRAVERFREARAGRTAPVAQWIKALADELETELEIKVSVRSLYRWDKLYKCPADATKLIDSRGGDQRSAGDPAAWTHFKQLYLDDRQPSMADCWRRTAIKAQAEGWQWPLYDAMRNRLREHISEEEELAAREPRKWRQQMAPYIDQDTERFAAGDCWVGDHAQLDLWCRAPGSRPGKVSLVRPWLTAWQDWRTRRIVGWTLSVAPNSSTILQAFKSGIEDNANHGGPTVVWIDNGKDYDAWLFHGQTKQQRLAKRHLEAGYIDEPEFCGLFGLLGIEVHFSLAHNPNGKARMERWFSTCHDQFDRSYVSYAGRSHEHKPESLKKVLERPNQVPTFEAIQAELADYIAAFNASAEHQVDDLVEPESGARLSPDQAMAQWCERRRVLADPESLSLFMQHWHKPVKMTRRGIKLTIGSQPLYYGGMNEHLSPFKALKAKDRPWLRVTYDPFDLSSVRIYNERFEFVCEAELNERGGASGKVDQQQVKDLHRRKREYAKALKTVESERELEYLSAAEVLTLSAGDQDPTLPEPTLPGAMQIVHTPLDGQSEAVRSHHKQAAGAEHDERPRQLGGGASRGGGLPDISDFMGGVAAPAAHAGEAEGASGGASAGASGGGGGGALSIDDFREMAPAGSASDADDDADEDDPYSAFKGGVL